MGIYDELSRLDDEATKDVENSAQSPSRPEFKRGKAPAMRTVERDTRTGLPGGSAEHPNGTPERDERVDAAVKSVERHARSRKQVVPPTVLSELVHGAVEEREMTERFSFEIYPSQLRRLREFRHRYYMRNGREVSASRMIREALESYLAKLEQVLPQKP
ncbi:MAG: hypothetical protein U0531_22605 [Dehalococcoidia bacterium]